MKKILFVINLLVALSLFGEVTPQILLREMGLPLLPAKQNLKHTDLEKQLSRYRIRFSGNVVKRTAFISGRKIFGILAKELQIISDANGNVRQVDIIFNNKGDTKERAKSRIHDDARGLRRKLIQLLGPWSKEKFGAKGFETKVFEWTHGSVKFQLEYVRKEYTILHIVYSGDPSGPESKRSITPVLTATLKKNVVKRENGDVFIDNIPMVDQGPKGYCVVATMERNLIYFGIKNVSQHQLADAAKTGRGGGTYIADLLVAMRKFSREYGFDVVSFKGLSIKTISKYIDKGVPVLWSMYHNDSYFYVVKKSRTERERFENLKMWLRSLRRHRVRSRGAAHVCLIIGYNKETDEIAVSNSWGDNEIKPGWVPLKFARKVSQGTCCVLVPKE